MMTSVIHFAHVKSALALWRSKSLYSAIVHVFDFVLRVILSRLRHVFTG